MIFPENANFEYFFSTITHKIKLADKSYVQELIFEADTEINLHNGIKKIIPAKSLYVKVDTVISLKAIKTKISKYLHSVNHVSNETIVNSIIYILTFIDLKNNAVKTINKVLKNITSVDINQFLIYPIKVDTYHVDLNHFQIGVIDHNKIQSYCLKIKTDYYDLYGDLIRDKFGVTRKYFQVNVLNLVHITQSAIKYDDIFKEAIYFYFEELSKVYEEEFYNKFDEAQELVTFLSNSYLDLKQWNLFLYPNIYLTIFLNFDKDSKLGWIVPKAKKTTLKLGEGPTNQEIYRLKNKYGFSDFGNGELDIAFRKFISFCSKGERYLIGSKINEAFLHNVIALDLLFGDKDASTQSVARRTAFVIGFSNSEDFDLSVKKIKNIYDLRSKYVHEGISIDKDKFEDLKTICLKVFERYLTLHKLGKLTKMKYVEWIKKLDLGVAMLEASETPSVEYLQNCGIILNQNNG